MDDSINNISNHKSFENHGNHHKPKLSFVGLFLILSMISIVVIMSYYMAVCKQDIENNIVEYKRQTEAYTREVVLKVQGGARLESLTTYSEKQEMYNVKIKNSMDEVVSEHRTGKKETFIESKARTKYRDEIYDINVVLTLDLISLGQIYPLYRVSSITFIFLIINSIITVTYGLITGELSFKLDDIGSNLTDKDKNALLDIINGDSQSEENQEQKGRKSTYDQTEDSPDMRASKDIAPGLKEKEKEEEVRFTGKSWVDNDTSISGTYDEKEEISNGNPEANNVNQTSFSNAPSSGTIYGYVEKDEVSVSDSNNISISQTNEPGTSGSMFGYVEPEKNTNSQGNIVSSGRSQGLSSQQVGIGDLLVDSGVVENPESKKYESDFTEDASELVKNTVESAQKNKPNFLNDEEQEVKTHIVKREDKKTEQVTRGPIKNVENFLREKARNNIVKQQVKIDNLEYEINKNLAERIENVTFKSEVKDVNLDVDVGKIVDAIGKVITTDMKENPNDKNLKLDINCKRKEDGKVLFSITDNTKGEIDINKVFDPLYEAGEKLKDMRLATTLEIIKSHGGKIWAEKNKGDGKTIFFELDAKDIEEEDENNKY